jgi:hypothetical protein
MVIARPAADGVTCAAHRSHVLVAAQPRVGTDVEDRSCQQSGRRQPGAGALVGLRDELEGDRGEEHAATERGYDRRDARGKLDRRRDEAAGDEARTDGQPPGDG